MINPHYVTDQFWLTSLYTILKQFKSRLAGLLWIIILLHDPSAFKLKVANRWSDILLESRIHGSMTGCHHSPEAISPYHYTFINRFNSWYNALFHKCNVCFMPDNVL